MARIEAGQGRAYRRCWGRVLKVSSMLFPCYDKRKVLGRVLTKSALLLSVGGMFGGGWWAENGVRVLTATRNTGRHQCGWFVEFGATPFLEGYACSIRVLGSGPLGICLSYSVVVPAFPELYRICNAKWCYFPTPDKDTKQ